MADEGTDMTGTGPGAPWWAPIAFGAVPIWAYNMTRRPSADKAVKPSAGSPAQAAEDAAALAAQVGGGGESSTKKRGLQILLESNLNPQQRAALKQKLWLAGFYGDANPTTMGSGLLDANDVKALNAYGELLDYNPRQDNNPWQMLDEMASAAETQNYGMPLGTDVGALRKKAVDQAGAGAQAEMAIREYLNAQGVQMTDQGVWGLASKVASGETTMPEIQQRLVKDLVVGAFPGWQSELESGMTVSQLASPYIKSMASILELPESQVDVWDPKVREAMQGNGDPAQPRKPLWQFEQELKNDPRYEQTTQAKNQMGEIAMTLAQTFGLK